MEKGRRPPKHAPYLRIKGFSAASLAIMDIRSATTSDAAEISFLISSVSHFFTLNPDGKGADGFLKTIQPSSIAGYITSGKFDYLVAFVEGKLAGVVAVRDNKHLFHLFVAPDFQRQGIAAKLWAHAKSAAIQAGNIEGFTVNSTPYAVPVYERFGFTATGPKVEKHGIAFVPLKLKTGNEHG